MYHFIGIAFNAFFKVDHEIDIYVINSVDVIFFNENLLCKYTIDLYKHAKHAIQMTSPQ